MRFGLVRMRLLSTHNLGDIESWMDETHLFNLFSHTGEVTQVKIIRDKSTNLPAGYGFVYFTSPSIAAKILETHNGQPISGTNKVYRYFSTLFNTED
jgi:RNA recognition motif-containing protein